ncbi:gamma carbonic anhydrase family protein [Mycoplasmatota bacterium WC44]
MNIDNSVFIADGAKVIGNVTIKKDASIWFNVVIRSDMAKVEIGERSNIQDLAVLHDSIGFNTIIGDDITVGHGAIIHGAHIQNGALIGMGSIILDGAVVEEEALVAAGCVVPPGKVVPKRHLAVGNPMRIVKELSDEDVKSIQENKDHYLRLRDIYKK